MGKGSLCDVSILDFKMIYTYHVNGEQRVGVCWHTNHPLCIRIVRLNGCLSKCVTRNVEDIVHSTIAYSCSDPCNRASSRYIYALNIE